MLRRIALFACLACLTLSSPASGQVIFDGPDNRPLPPEIREQFRLKVIEVDATVKDQAAKVQLAQTFRNDCGRTIQAQFLFPLPEDAAISGLTLIVDGRELPGELKTKEEARRIYENIVRQRKDPALLEYVGGRVFRTSVFPIPADAERRVEIRYTQLLTKDGGLVDFSLPLGLARHAATKAEEVKVTVRLETTEAIKTVYSPTHDFDINRKEEHRATCKLELHNVTRPDDVRLLFGTHGDDIGMNLITYRPEPDEPGYFLLLASPKVKANRKENIAKTVMFVIDRSGSMSGEKIEQARASLKFMINQLGPGDTFNIVSYSSDIQTFRPELELVTDATRKAALAFAEDMYSGGGTAIDDALKTGLSQLVDRQRPNYVMFLTDGLPTVGTRDEREIAKHVEETNQAASRIFSFGVGYDVNSRLLDRLTRDTRGASVYVKPNEDIEVAASSLFRKVSQPALTSVDVQITAAKHDSDRAVTKRVYPRQMPDLFHGEQLVLVGRYNPSGDARVVLTGEVNGKKKKFTLDAKLDRHTDDTANAFVETLWAARRIGEIIDDLDLNGQNKELVDELVALSLKHGIMTPYTAFLADENVSLEDRDNFTRAERLSESLSSRVSGLDAFSERRFKQSLQSAPNAGSADQATEELEKAFGLGSQGLMRSGRGDAVGGFGGGGGRSQNAAGNLPTYGPARDPQGAPAAAKPGEPSDYPEGKSLKELVQRVGTKTLYWKGGEWRDSDITEKELEPPADGAESSIVTIEQFSDKYFELSSKDKSKWAKYLAVKEQLLIKLDGTIYRFVPPKE